MFYRLSQRIVFGCIGATLCFGAVSFIGRDAFSQEIRKVDDRQTLSENDWPWWRGPFRNGEGAPGQKLPVEWNATKNVRWKAAVAGRGYGSPCIVGANIFLLTSEEATGAQSLLCFDRESGVMRWKTVVHASGGMRKNERSTAASSTPACDGERVYVSFPNNGALWTSAIDLLGKVVWTTKICDYIEHQGYGASPAVYQQLLLVAADNKGGGALVALDRKTGQVAWKRDRPKLPNYPSPILIHAYGRDQLILTGCDLVSSFDPLTGNTLWETEGATTECVISTVTDGKHVFTSGGYPKNHMSAILADGSKAKVWENESRLYVPSPLVRDKHLYGVLDAGIAVCWDCETGKEKWRHRLGGTFSASPILVGTTIYATNESGETFLFRASPDRFEMLGKNQLGSEVFATPTLVGGRIYYRCTEEQNGQRQEYLYCLQGQ